MHFVQIFPLAFKSSIYYIDHFAINFPDYKHTCQWTMRPCPSLWLLRFWQSPHYISANGPLHFWPCPQAMLPCSRYNSSHAPVTLPCSQLHFSTPILGFLAPSPHPVLQFRQPAYCVHCYLSKSSTRLPYWFILFFKNCEIMRSVQ